MPADPWSKQTRPAAGRRRWAAVGGATVLTAAAVHAQPATSRSATSGSDTTRPVATAATAAAATRPARADVASLVRQLGADEETDREAAQQRLVDQGPAAVDALTVAAAGDADPEVRTRAAAALAQIRDLVANGPSLLTLHDHDADPAAVLGEIGDQAHVRLSGTVGGFGRGRQRVSIDADRRPFWDVLADVCGQLDVCPVLADPPNHGTMRLTPFARNWMRPGGPHEVVGPFWIGVAGISRQSWVDLSGPPLTEDLFLARLLVYPEPKLVVTQISPLVLREARDDAGNSLVPPPVAGRNLFRPAGRQPTLTVEVRLKYPADHAGHRIATLAGDLTVTLAQGARRFEAVDVLTHPSVTGPLPGVVIRVGAKMQGPSYYQVTVECVRVGLADDQWQAMTNRVGDLVVEDAAGRSLSPLQWSPDGGNSDTTFKATGLFTRTQMNNLLINRAAAVAGGNAPAAIAPPPPAGEPAKVVWNVAARFKVVTIPVAFHDLPMP